MKQRIYTLLIGAFLGALFFGTAQAASENTQAQRSTNSIYVDGRRVELDAWNIEGSNYVKLRDIGKAVSFEVYWDGSAVQIVSDAPYTGKTPLHSVDTEKNDAVWINELSSAPGSSSFFMLSRQNYREYTKEGLFAHYQYQFDLSDVFPEMIEYNTDSYGIYVFPDESDMLGHSFVWGLPEGSARICVGLRLGGVPLSSYTLKCEDNSPKVSIIAGKELYIYHFNDGSSDYYYTEFMHGDLGFSLSSSDVTLEDFTHTIAYLIAR